ncbi:MAG: hypothetical protein EAZ55_07385 [Cytophagales bacterium]|nr:MAG: hypothetical protein EAZ55_07385 [Cytophagales bacterium]
MTIKCYFLLCVYLFLNFNSLFAQLPSNSKWRAEGSWAHASEKFQISASLHRIHSIALKQKFSIGYGLRFSFFEGRALNYISAPPLLAADQSKQAQWYLNDAQVNFLNLEIHLHYQLLPRIELGFNIDALGLSWGAPKEGILNLNNGTQQLHRGTPTAYNILLIGNADVGSLNANSYIVYRVNQHWGVGLSYSHLYTEYTLDQKVVANFENDRFRNKSWLLRWVVRYYFGN